MSDLLWRGKYLDSYDKADLIEIIEQLVKKAESDSKEHFRHLKVLQKAGW